MSLYSETPLAVPGGWVKLENTAWVRSLLRYFGPRRGLELLGWLYAVQLLDDERGGLSRASMYRNRRELREFEVALAAGRSDREPRVKR